MTVKLLRLALLAALAASLLVPVRAAAAPDGDARAFIDKVFERASWQDMTSTVRLTMTNKRGDQRRRLIKMWSKKNAQGESRMLMRFVEPADVRGMGFLQIEHDGAEDDRRLFIAAMRRVKRISAAGSGGHFMSSDFSYYDVGRPKLADWTYAFTGERVVAGVACRSVTGTAASAKVTSDTGYSKVVWHVDPTRMVALAADYFDEDGARFKAMEGLKVEDVAGTPFVTHMRMTDVTTGHVSEMLFEGLETDRGVADDTFTERSLRRWTQ